MSSVLNVEALAGAFNQEKAWRLKALWLWTFKLANIPACVDTLAATSGGRERRVTDAGSQVSVSEDHLLQPAPHTALQDRVASKLYGVTGKKKQRHQNRIWGYFPFKSIYFWLYKLLLVDITANCHRPVDQCEDQCKSWNKLPFWNTNADWHYFQGFDFS